MVINEALPAEYRVSDALFRELCDDTNASVYHVRDLNTLNKLTEEYYELAVELVYKEMERRYDYMVIESYSDVALPWKGLKDLDIVIGVKPGRLSVFDAEKYLSAVQLSASIHQDKLSTSSIVELLKPIKEVMVPPLRSEETVQGLMERIPMLLEHSG